MQLPLWKQLKLLGYKLMTEIHGYTIPEAYKGQFQDLVIGVDPYYHRAIACGLAYLAQDYGDKAEDMLDGWFTAVYGTVMEMEEVMDTRVERYACDCSLADNRDSLDFKDIEAID